MDPINYQTNVQTPFQSVLQGFQAGAGINQVQQQAAQQQQQQQLRVDLAALASKPNPTGQDYAAMMTKYPQLSEHFKRPWDVLNTQQQQAKLSQATQVQAALLQNQPEIAAKLLRDQATAARNSGSEQDAAAAETMSKLIDIDPKAAKTSVGMWLSSIMGPEKFATTFGTLGDQQRSAEKAPADLKKANAEADIKTGEASVEPRKSLAGTALIEAQTEEAKKRTEKLGAEIGQLSAGGGLDPEKRFDFEAKLRKEYNTQTANFQNVKEAHARIKSAQDSGPGDITLVYSFMKVLDPTSVVREGEFATAENSAGIPEKVWNLYNKALKGERLTPGQRKTFTGQSEALVKAAEQREKVVRSGIDNVVKSYKLNADNVFYVPSTSTGAPQAQPTATDVALPPALKNKGWAKY